MSLENFSTFYRLGSVC